MSWDRLENTKFENAAVSEETLLEGFNKQMTDIKVESFANATKEQLANFIEKEFQTTDGKRLTYAKMKEKGNFYALALEAAMDFISDILGDKKYTEEGVEDTTTDGTGKGKTLDERLKAYGGIDATDDEKNTKIVLLLQKILGITDDGLAGPETMANIVALLKWSTLEKFDVEWYDENNPYAYSTISSLVSKKTDDTASDVKTDESTSMPADTEKKVETGYSGKFEEDSIEDPKTKLLKLIPEGFDPETGEVDIFFCGYGVTIEDQKKVFEENKVTSDHAILIIEGDPDHIARGNKPAQRYNEIKNNAATFRESIENDILEGKVMKNICLIGHSWAGTVVNKLKRKFKKDSDKKANVLIVDGTYGPDQSSEVEFAEGDKIYYVPETTTAGYAPKGSTPMTGTTHFSIIPKALQDAWILQA